MKLKRWLELNPAAAFSVSPHTAIVSIQDTDTIAPNRAALWGLEDYAVSVVRAGCVWLIAKSVTDAHAQTFNRQCDYCQLRYRPLDSDARNKKQYCSGVCESAAHGEIDNEELKEED